MLGERRSKLPALASSDSNHLQDILEVRCGTNKTTADWKNSGSYPKEGGKNKRRCQSLCPINLQNSLC